MTNFRSITCKETHEELTKHEILRLQDIQINYTSNRKKKKKFNDVLLHKNEPHQWKKIY